MIINTRNLPEIGMREDGTFNITKSGKYLFKIESWEEKGFVAKTGDAMFLINFKGVEVGKKEPVYTHNELYNAGATSLRFLKKLEVAIKSPEVYNLDDWKGRYVIVNIDKVGEREHNGKKYDRFGAISWEYSSHNDKLPPVPEAKLENDSFEPKNKVPEIEIDEDEIPF